MTKNVGVPDTPDRSAESTSSATWPAPVCADISALNRSVFRPICAASFGEIAVRTGEQRDRPDVAAVDTAMTTMPARSSTTEKVRRRARGAALSGCAQERGLAGQNIAAPRA